MPGTFKEVATKLKLTNPSVNTPETNIMCGIYYDSTLWKQWSSERPLQDRLSFMWGSYNAGIGNILKAQKLVTNSTSLDPNL